MKPIYTVYSKPNCPFCDQAKALLDSKDQLYVEIHLDVGQPKVDGEVYISREQLLEIIPTARTMPQIQVSTESGRETIGGFTELKAHLA